MLRYRIAFSLAAAFLVARPGPAAALSGETHRIGPGRVLFTQTIRPSHAGKPTFLMLPGVNRSLLAEEPAAKAIAAKGYGVATFNFSVQPLSIAALEEGERPAFRAKDLSLEDLAEEAESFAASLSGTRLIPVSLSYSGAVSPYLRGFPLIIETAPLTSAAAQNPDLDRYRQTLRAAELWNPVFGPGITRASLDQSYKSVWRGQVDATLRQFDLPASRREDMIEGYTVMSRATEGFAWKGLELPAETRRVFILGGGEARPLRSHQIETFLGLLESRTDALLVLIEGAGHIIPSEQPRAFADVLDLIATNGFEIASGVVVVSPSTGRTRVVPAADAAAFLRGLR
ncbi:MAG: hypothetical protein HY078_04995 [Elusimicrobia bacterium]|nr:hypothetical protein [Elusimicrobiota bacterium]